MWTYHYLKKKKEMECGNGIAGEFPSYFGNAIATFHFFFLFLRNDIVGSQIVAQTQIK